MVSTVKTKGEPDRVTQGGFDAHVDKDAPAEEDESPKGDEHRLPEEVSLLDHNHQ